MTSLIPTVHPNHIAINILDNQQTSAPTATSTSRRRPWLLGRCVERLHFSQACTGCGSTVGTIVSVFSGVAAYFSWTSGSYTAFGISLLTGSLGMVTAITNCVGTGFLCAWKPRKRLEQAVQDVGQATQQLNKQKVELERRVQELQEANKQLGLQLQAEKSIHQQALHEIDNKKVEIERLVAKLDLIQKSLVKATELAKSWKQSANLISKQVDRFEPKKLTHEVESLQYQLSDIELAQDGIDEDLQELQTLAKEMQTLNSSWKEMVEKIQSTFTLLSQDYLSKRQDLEKASKEIDRLAGTIKELNQTNGELGTTLRDFKELEERYNIAIEKINELQPYLESSEFQELIKKLGSEQK